jgi:DNA-binding response OmpR family regulator
MSVPAECVAKESKSGSPAEELRGTTVLSIDDDPEVGRALQIGLGRHGVDVLCAYSGVQGLWLAMTHRPSVVITDIGMPSGNGDEVIDCLQRNAETKAIPLVVLSGCGDPVVRRRLVGRGIEAWLTKPISDEELIAALRPLAPPRSTGSILAKGNGQ